MTTNLCRTLLTFLVSHLSYSPKVGTEIGKDEARDTFCIKKSTLEAIRHFSSHLFQ